MEALNLLSSVISVASKLIKIGNFLEPYVQPFIENTVQPFIDSVTAQ